jgi:hypothetical protein
MTKKKGPKKPKTEFMVKRIERKKTRHLKSAAVAAPVVAAETPAK